MWFFKNDRQFLNLAYRKRGGAWESFIEPSSDGWVWLPRLRVERLLLFAANLL